MALTNKLTAIANAIREKTGNEGGLTLEQMPTAIASITTGSTDIPFEYGGTNAVKISEYSQRWTLADTSFVIGSSASTTATSIKASVSNAYTSSTGSPTYNYGDGDIVVVQKCLAKPTHDSTATPKALFMGFSYVYVTIFSRRKSTPTATTKTVRQAYNYTSNIAEYYNTSGVLTRGVVNYGFYMSPTAPNTYSTTANSTYVRCSTPTLYYRAGSSYETTANIKLVTECTFDWSVEVYKVDAFSTITATVNNELDDMLVNGFGD